MVSKQTRHDGLPDIYDGESGWWEKKIKKQNSNSYTSL